MYVIFLLALFLNLPILAQEMSPVGSGPDPEALHDELRTLKTNILTALNKRDIDTVLGLVDDNMIFVPMNAELCKGKEAIRNYFDRMLTGTKRIISDMELSLEVAELTTLHGTGTGIAYGKTSNIFKLSSGVDLKINAGWTATLVKKDNRWLLASYQSTVNPFDNPIINKAKSFAGLATVGAGLIGCVIGVVVVSIVRRKKCQE